MQRETIGYTSKSIISTKNKQRICDYLNRDLSEALSVMFAIQHQKYTSGTGLEETSRILQTSLGPSWDNSENF